MRIAFVTLMEGFAWGGSEELWVATAQQAIKEKHSVVASIHARMAGHPKVNKLEEQGACIHVRPQVPAPGYVAASLPRRIARRISCTFHNAKPVSMYETLARFQADLFCISSGHVLDLLWHEALRSLVAHSGKPYCIINHYNDEKRVISLAQADVLRTSFNAAKRVFFVSDRNLSVTRRQILSQVGNARVIRNPVNMADTSIIAFPDRPVVHFACVARLDCQYKGQEILLEVLSAAKWKKRDWRLHLYGAGPDEEYLRELISFYGLSERIALEGHVTDIRSVWEQNHIQLMPSAGEGTPIALVEAMLCGRPAVVTDVGGNAEIIEEEVTGFVAGAASVKSFDKALEKAWLNQSQWATMGVQAHNYAADVLMKNNPAITLLDYLTACAG